MPTIHRSNTISSFARAVKDVSSGRDVPGTDGLRYIRLFVRVTQIEDQNRG